MATVPCGHHRALLPAQWRMVRGSPVRAVGERDQAVSGNQAASRSTFAARPCRCRAPEHGSAWWSGGSGHPGRRCQTRCLGQKWLLGRPDRQQRSTATLVQNIAGRDQTPSGSPTLAVAAAAMPAWAHGRGQNVSVDDLLLLATSPRPCQPERSLRLLARKSLRSLRHRRHKQTPAHSKLSCHARVLVVVPWP